MWVDKHQVIKEEHPTYLGVTLDRQLSLKNHIKNIKNKALRRLQLLKRLAGTTWGSDKDTLRGLYLGYVRSVNEYNRSLLTTCSKSNLESIDRVQNNALRLISGAMRSTPTAACEIHTSVGPLGLRRDKAALEMYERCKRMNRSHPNRHLVENWEYKQRIKHKSVLHHVQEIQDRYHLPERRQGTQNVARNLPPHARLKAPEVRMRLVDSETKQSDPVTLMNSSLKTIDAYPEEWIHVYTDGSAFKANTKAGYGVHIRDPDGSIEDIFDACGEFCSNYETEIIALETAVYHLKTVLEVQPSKAQHFVIFTDSMSALQALEGSERCRTDIATIILDADQLITSHNIKIVLQWIPGHLKYAR